MTDLPLSYNEHEEFNLSEKIFDGEYNDYVIDTEDVREFIRLLKEEVGLSIINEKRKQYLIEKIDKLAGEKLSK